MFLLLVDLVAKPGKENDLKAVFENLVEPSRAEAGCIEYTLYQSQDNPSAFTVVEKWKDQAALDNHETLPHFTENVPKIGDLLVSPPTGRKLNVAVG